MTFVHQVMEIAKEEIPDPQGDAMDRARDRYEESQS